MLSVGSRTNGAYRTEPTTMPIPQLDRVVAFERDRSLRAIKCLTLSEDYLQDHFPKFPVMPGVMMLEALFQAGAWLLRVSDDFQRPLVSLREARGVKYQDFVAPGDSLVIDVTISKRTDDVVQVKASGEIGGRAAVSGRLVLGFETPTMVRPGSESTIGYCREEMKRQWLLLSSQLNTGQ